MTIVEAIKEGFKVTNQNRKLVLIVFCISLFFSFLSILLFPSIQGDIRKIESVIGLISLSIIAALVGILIDCGIRGSLKDILLEGEYQGNRFFFYCRKYFLRLLGLAILIGGVWGVMIGFLLPSGILAAFELFEPLSGVGIVIVIAIAIILVLFISLLILRLFLILFYAYTTIVIEDSKFFPGITKSFRFVKKYVRKVLGLLLILLGVSGVIGWGLQKIAQLETTPKVADYGIEIVKCGLQAYLEIIVIAACMILYLALKEEPSPEKSGE